MYPSGGNRKQVWCPKNLNRRALLQVDPSYLLGFDGAAWDGSALKWHFSHWQPQTLKVGVAWMDGWVFLTQGWHLEIINNNNNNNNNSNNSNNDNNDNNNNNNTSSNINVNINININIKNRNHNHNHNHHHHKKKKKN